jgi:hypothetical protein
MYISIQNKKNMCFLVEISGAKNTKWFRLKPRRNRVGEIITAKHKSKIENIGVIRYGDMAKLAK